MNSIETLIIIVTAIILWFIHYRTTKTEAKLKEILDPIYTHFSTINHALIFTEDQISGFKELVDQGQRVSLELLKRVEDAKAKGIKLDDSMQNEIRECARMICCYEHRNALCQRMIESNIKVLNGVSISNATKEYYQSVEMEPWLRDPVVEAKYLELINNYKSPTI